MLKLTTPSSILFWDPTKLESYEFEALAYEESIKLAVSDCSMDDFSDLMVQLGMSATTLSPSQCHMVKSVIAFERAFPGVIDNLSVIHDVSSMPGHNQRLDFAGGDIVLKVWRIGNIFQNDSEESFTSLYNALVSQYIDSLKAKAFDFGDRDGVLGTMIQQEVAW